MVSLNSEFLKIFDANDGSCNFVSFRPKLTKIENASVVITPCQIALFQKVKYIHINPSIIGPPFKSHVNDHHVN